MAASKEEYEGLEKMPISLDCEPHADTRTGQISLKKFHNMFYDGFYAPFLKNPLYLLVIDCRDEDAFSESHVAAARWHGHISLFNERNFDFVKFGVIIMYDYDGTGFSTPGTEFSKMYEHLKSRRFEPLVLSGGFEAIHNSCPYMLTDNQFPARERSLTVHWYPLMIQVLFSIPFGLFFCATFDIFILG
jgi:hypothetical protein